jgi:hypothetical protein
MYMYKLLTCILCMYLPYARTRPHAAPRLLLNAKAEGR